MAHVQCDATGAVVGLFANPQENSLEIADDDPRLAAFRRRRIAPLVAEECQRRIYAIASQNCQMNMTAWMAGGRASEQDKLAFGAALVWVQAMRAACAELSASDDEAFLDDGNWPACPPEVAALAARF